MRTRQTTSTDSETAAVVPAPLQRACGCGATAGASGRCNVCAARSQFGIQPKLTLGAPDDRYEQEADRIADQVMAAGPGPANGPMAVTPLPRPAPLTRQVEDEPEDEDVPLQAKSAFAASRPALSHDFGRRLTNELRGGQPLDPAARAFFEPRFGRDLGAVRLHRTGTAADLNREIGARAFTHGNHVLLGNAAANSGQESQRRLLAHEITHTLQQEAASSTTLQRAPERGEDETGPEVESFPTDQIHAFTKATVRDRQIPAEERVDAVHEGPAGPYFPGDVILVSVRQDLIEDGKKAGLRGIAAPIEWHMPEGTLELAGGGDADAKTNLGGSDFFLRVVVDPETLGDGQVVDVAMGSDAFDETVTFGVALEPSPEDTVAIDPEGLAKEEVLETLREERSDVRSKARDAGPARRKARKALRETQQKEREALRERQDEEGAYSRKERKADRKERQALRRAQKGKRHALRDEQKEERDAFKAQKRKLRGQISDLRGDIRDIDRESECTLDQQHLVEAALETAMARAAAALARIRPGDEPDPFTQAKLKEYFRLDVTPDNGDAVRGTLQRTVDVINLAINSMKLADHTQFVCAGSPIACDETTGAFVSDLQRGGTVTVCNKWITGKASYGAAGSGDPGRAYGLLHEFIHLSGITTQDRGDAELYTHSDDWKKLSPEETAKMADAYAAFAWAMGGGAASGGGEGGDGS